MEIVFWILLCMLAYVGAIEIFGRIYYGIKPQKAAAKAYLVVPLASCKELMREQMEYYVSWLEWNGEGHIVLLVHNATDKTAAEMFKRYLNDFSGIELCCADRLISRLQNH